MSIITDTENASQFPLVSGQPLPGEAAAQKIEAKPTHAAATTAERQTRRAKSNASQSVGGEDTHEGSSATDISPLTPTTSNRPKKTSKQDIVLGLLRQAEGATIDELMDATEWQAHSVRGFLSGTVRKKLKLKLISDVVGNGVRRYHVEPGEKRGSGGDVGQPTPDGPANEQVA